MGYDMQIKGALPEPDAELVAALETAYNAALVERDNAVDRARLAGREPHGDPEVKAAMDKAFEAHDKLISAKDPGYFRLNIWGMGRFRRVMHELGMLADSRQPDDSEWPEGPDREGGPEYGTPEYDRAEARYMEEVEPLLMVHGADEPGIPIHKLGSNDGWTVTPDEINAALAAYRANRADVEPRSDTETAAAELEAAASPFGNERAEPSAYDTIRSDYWQEWIAYLERAAGAEGFKVH